MGKAHSRPASARRRPAVSSYDPDQDSRPKSKRPEPFGPEAGFELHPDVCRCHERTCLYGLDEVLCRRCGRLWELRDVRKKKEKDEGGEPVIRLIPYPRFHDPHYEARLNRNKARAKRSSLL